MTTNRFTFAVRTTAPTGLSSSATTTSTVSLAWNPVTYATGYRVYRNGSLVAPIPPATLTGTTYEDTGLAQNTTYNYTVSAVSAGGESVQSASVPATTQGSQPGTNVPLPANFPLELVSPRAAGTAPTAALTPGGTAFPPIPAGHRIFKAHPGIPYNIRAVVIGGSYPFTFTLANAPSGMTINSRTGEINWPNPQEDATPTITVTDSFGAQQSSSWAITVTATGFRFVSPTGNDAAAGTIDAPWQTMLKVYNSALGADIVYWRTGTYTNDGIPRQGTGGAWERIDFGGGNKSARWIAYPGETPRFDCGYEAGVDPSALIRFTVNAAYPIWLDGIEVFNFRNIGIQPVSGSHYMTIRRVKVHDMIFGVDGENPAGIMFTASYTGIGWYAAIQDSEFYNLNNGGGMKFYSQGKFVVEDNLFRDSTSGFDIKSHVHRWDLRANTFRNISNESLYGNQHYNTPEPVTGEIRYNNINTLGTASYSLDLNQDGAVQAAYIYRNTVAGKFQIRWANATTGPFYVSNNVIVNNDTESAQNDYISYYNSDGSRIIRSNNLAGVPSLGIIDANGLLTGSYLSYRGTRGHEIPGS